MKWYLLSANQGNPSAQNHIGALYENGEGVDKDYKEALKWYLLSANQGNLKAQKALGYIYQLFEEEEKSLFWLLKCFDKEEDCFFIF